MSTYILLYWWSYSIQREFKNFAFYNFVQSKKNNDIDKHLWKALRKMPPEILPRGKMQPESCPLTRPPHSPITTSSSKDNPQKIALPRKTSPPRKLTPMSSNKFLNFLLIFFISNFIFMKVFVHNIKFIFIPFISFIYFAVHIFKLLHLMFIMHRYITDNTGQPYQAIETNLKEVSLTLWGSHKTPKLWWLPKHTIITFNLR